jgi:hypothetical protein
MIRKSDELAGGYHYAGHHQKHEMASPFGSARAGWRMPRAGSATAEVDRMRLCSARAMRRLILDVLAAMALAVPNVPAANGAD